VNHGNSFTTERRLNFLALLPWVMMALSWVVTWLATAESSPFSGYIHTHEGADEWWLWPNIIPFFVVARLSIPSSVAKFLVFMFGVSTQWFIVGWVISFSCRWLVNRFSHADKTLDG
jgi:hypothetical protein